MNRSPNPNAAIREKVDYFIPESNGEHTYSWPYDVHWLGIAGIIVRSYQADINIDVEPPTVEVIHWERTETDGQPLEPQIRPADSAEVTRMIRLIEEDHGPDAVGLGALQAFAVNMALKS
jgi:hypothetical protein